MASGQTIIAGYHRYRVRRLDDLFDHRFRVVFQRTRDDDEAGEREIAFVLFAAV